jgi:hypothetical protein
VRFLVNEHGCGAIMGIEGKIKKLAPELHKEVEDHVDFLLQSTKKKPEKKLRLDWAGSLKESRDKYPSVELQHKISKWRLEDELNKH